MEYKTCKHEDSKNCRECRCGAWCKDILACVCGCHNKPTYSFTDYMNAQHANAELSQSLHIVAGQQAAERRRMLARTKELDAQLNPFREKQGKAAEHLADLKRRLLGPWEDRHDYGSYSHIYILNAATEIRNGRTEKVWYHNRVWLRAKGGGRDALVWSVRIQGLEEREGNKEWDFGVRNKSISYAADLEINKKLAEPYIIKMGYILSI